MGFTRKTLSLAAAMGFAVAAIGSVTVVRFLLRGLLEDRSAFAIYVPAVLLSAFFGGWLAGITATVVATVAAGAFFIWPHHPLAQNPRTLSDLCLYSTVGFSVTWISVRLRKALRRAVELAAEKERALEELRSRSAEVHTLHGLLPICASCKRIRDDQGYWERLEVYLHQHSDATFTHGMCPACAKSFYAELDRELEKLPPEQSGAETPLL